MSLPLADRTKAETSSQAAWPTVGTKPVVRTKKGEFSQFMTPPGVARFMAAMFPASTLETCRLLDAGAGRGALSGAFLERWQTGNFGFGAVEVTAPEIDDTLHPELAWQLALSGGDSKLEIKVIAGDFIEAATAESAQAGRYTHVVLNPPYQKIGSHSAHRLALRQVGIETGNLYSAFVALALLQSAPGAQLVAIIPRSFCNGPYYRPFRNFLLERAAIRHIHLFESRSETFRSDGVLQENIIIRLERGGQQGSVTVTTSADGSFSDLASYEHPFDRIVLPGDSEQFIHIPMSLERSTIESMPSVRSTLTDLGLRVSTGPVVDFRLSEHLRAMPEEGTVPLIYPGHLHRNGLVWPLPGTKKPNAILRNDSTEKWLYPNGFYCVVRRFSSKEERRRVVASVIEPLAFGDHTLLGFENHINLFHEDRHGLPELLARGLAVFLNTTAVDESFRALERPYPGQCHRSEADELSQPRRADGTGQVGQRAAGTYARPHRRAAGEAACMTNNGNEHIESARQILVSLGLPKAQQNERSALCLLALLNLTPGKSWAEAECPLVGITPIMTWVREHYGREYAPNTRETFRRQTMHQFCAAGLALSNPDRPDRPVNSPKAVYQIEPAALTLLRSFGTPQWHDNLTTYLAGRGTLIGRYARAREHNRIPVQIAPGKQITLSPGEHSELIRAIIQDFAPRFAPGSALVYVGDTGNKWGYFDAALLAELGVQVNAHGKMPDVVLHYTEKNWLLLVESVTSHGPVDGKRHAELARLFAASKVGLVYVTAFPNRSIMGRYLGDIAWETEVWVADAPSHLIHFDGVRFLGPYADS